jgi:hypothetical protein
MNYAIVVANNRLVKDHYFFSLEFGSTATTIIDQIR